MVVVIPRRSARTADEPMHSNVRLPRPPMRIQHMRKRCLAGLHHRVIVSDEVPHETDDLATQGIFVDAFDHTILDHHPPVNHHALHAAPGFGINELPSRAVVGKVGDVIEIDEDQVRLVARPDGAEATGETGRSRVADRGMAQDLVREARTRLRLADRGGEAKHLHRLEHALHVATAAVVAAQP